MVEERRKSRRYPTIAEVSYEYIGLFHQGRITDLSLGGFFIDTMNPLPEGSAIGFKFSLPGDDSETPLAGEGLVIWQHPMEGMGVLFTRISDEDRERLGAFLSKK